MSRVERRPICLRSKDARGGKEEREEGEKPSKLWFPERWKGQPKDSTASGGHRGYEPAQPYANRLNCHMHIVASPFSYP